MKRILLKLSGEALAGSAGHGLDYEMTVKAGRQIKAVVDKGVQVCIVIGGGNFWRGRSSDEIDRVKADQVGMLATVMNALYVSEVFKKLGMPGVVYTPYPIGLYTKVFNKDNAIEDLEKGKLVFFAGGTGHPYFSTDMCAALRAVETECDMILMAKSVDGVYDSDPRKNPNAKKYDKLSYKEMVQQCLQVIDLTAAVFCMENHMPSKLFALAEEGSIIKALDGDNIGTVLE